MAFIGPPGIPGSTTGRTCCCWHCGDDCKCTCYTCRPRGKGPPPQTPQQVIYQELLAAHRTQDGRPRPTMADAAHMWYAVDLSERKRLIGQAAINRDYDISVDMDATFVCFSCRKDFRRKFIGSMEAVVYGDLLMTSGGTFVTPGNERRGLRTNTYCQRCSDCKGQLYCVGPGFTTPKRKDNKGWTTRECLVRYGYMHSPCDCFKASNAIALDRLGVAHVCELDSKRAAARLTGLR